MTTSPEMPAAASTMSAYSLALIRNAAFVGRCSGAATCAYAAVTAVGLPHSVWGVISALVVSQEKLYDTGASLACRIQGTIVGVCVAILVGLAASKFAMTPSVQIGVAVAVCAIVARMRPTLRVCMWTVPIVLLTDQLAVPIGQVGLQRGAEVILGGLIGGAFHFTAEILGKSIGCQLSRG